MSIALFTGLGGMFAGAAQGYQQAQDRAMRDLLLKAQLTQMGATHGWTPDVPQASPDQIAPGLASVAGSSPALAPNLGATPPIPPGVLAQAQAQSQAGQGVAGQIPSGVVAQGLVSPSAGVVPETASGTTTPQLPTDQASIIQMNRAAQGGSGSSTSAAAASPLLATLRAAGAQVPSGTPTPGATPTGADPIGGADSGLTPALANAVAKYKAAMPTGRVDIGQGWSMPQVMAPQQAAMQQALLGVVSAAAERQAAYKQAQTLEQGRETFEGGQQSNLLAAEAQRQTQALAQAKEIAAADRALTSKKLDQQMAWEKVLTGFRETGQTQAAQKQIQAPLQPLETKLQQIGQATALVQQSGADPTAVSSALLDAAVALGPTDQARLSKQLDEIAPDVAGKSLPAKVARVAQMTTAGTLPKQQMSGLLGTLGAAGANVKAQYLSNARSAVAMHPEAAGLLPMYEARADSLGKYIPAATAQADPAAAAIASGGGTYQDYLKARGVKAPPATQTAGAP